MNKFSNETFESEESEEVHPELSMGTGAYDAMQAQRHADSQAEDPQGIHVRDIEAQAAAAQRGPVRLVQKTSKRVKRTEAEMIKSLGGSALKEATYVAERIQKLEDKISELLGSVSQKAREHILNDFPHLSRY